MAAPPTCFHLSSQDSLSGERQQTDDVVHRTVGLLGKVLPQLQGVVSAEEKLEHENAVGKCLWRKTTAKRACSFKKCFPKYCKSVLDVTDMLLVGGKTSQNKYAAVM